MTADDAWIELRLDVPEADPTRLEPLDEACIRVSPGGFVVEGADAPPGDEDPPAAGHVRYKLYVGESQREAASATLTQALASFDGATLRASPLQPGWRDRWKRWFKPIVVSERLTVTTPWEPIEAEDRQVIVIEPGLAFGTGQHETTWLCMAALDTLAAQGTLPGRVLDVGCGSGLLSVLAARLGAGEVVGVDIDPMAVVASRENAERNEVLDQTRFSTTAIAEVDGTYPLVIANIMAHILIAMAAPLSARVAPGGRLMLSGVLREQVAEVCEAFEAEGLTREHVAVRAGWTRIDMSRP